MVRFTTGLQKRSIGWRDYAGTNQTSHNKNMHRSGEVRAFSNGESLVAAR